MFLSVSPVSLMTKQIIVDIFHSDIIVIPCRQIVEKIFLCLHIAEENLEISFLRLSI